MACSADVIRASGSISRRLRIMRESALERGARKGLRSRPVDGSAV